MSPTASTFAPFSMTTRAPLVSPRKMSAWRGVSPSESTLCSVAVRVPRSAGNSVFDVDWRISAKVRSGILLMSLVNYCAPRPAGRERLVPGRAIRQSARQRKGKSTFNHPAVHAPAVQRHFGTRLISVGLEQEAIVPVEDSLKH